MSVPSELKERFINVLSKLLSHEHSSDNNEWVLDSSDQQVPVTHQIWSNRFENSETANKEMLPFLYLGGLKVKIS